MIPCARPQNCLNYRKKKDPSPQGPVAAGGGGRLGGAAETFPVTTTDLEEVLAGGGVLAVEGALGGEGALVAEEGSKDQVTLVKQVRKTRKFVFRKSIRHTYYMMCNKNLFRVLCIVCFFMLQTQGN